MPERSHVTSVEAIEAFRANLIVYLSKARPAVEEISNDVLRTRHWLEIQQRNHWDKEVRVRRRELEEAQQELLTSKISKLRDATTAKEMAVQRALRCLHDAEEKQALTRKWGRELENRAEPLLKQVQQLHSFLASDMGKAVVYLDQVVKALEAYADIAAPGSSAGASPSTGETSSAPQPTQTPAGEASDAGAGEGDRT